MDLGLVALRLDLTGTQSIAELQQRLRDYAAANPKRCAWIIGFGWNQELWPNKRFPTAADLDAVVSDRPVVLERVDGHAIVVNSAAHEGRRRDGRRPRSPAGGEIDDGLFVDAARGLIDKRSSPPPTDAELDQALAKAQEQLLLGYGVTAVGSMSTDRPAADWEAMQPRRRSRDAQRAADRPMRTGSSR